MSFHEQFIKSIIKQRLVIEDPETYEKLVDVIYKFAMILMYGDEKLKSIAIDLVFQIVPEDIVISILQNYAYKVKQRYDRIKQVLGSLGLSDSARGGRNVEDMFLNMMLEMYKQQMGIGSAGSVPSVPQQNQSEPVKIKEIPPELRKILDEESK